VCRTEPGTVPPCIISTSNHQLQSAALGNFTTMNTSSSEISPVELALLNAMRRHKRLIAAYAGQQPADRHLRKELAWAVEAYLSDGNSQMARLTERLNAALPPVGMSPARAKRLNRRFSLIRDRQ